MKDHQIPQPAGGAELRVSGFSVRAHSALTDLVEAAVGGEDGDAAVFGDGAGRSGAAVATPAAGHLTHLHRSRRGFGFGFGFGGRSARSAVPGVLRMR